MIKTFRARQCILDRLVGPVGTRERYLYDNPTHIGVIDSVSCGIPIGSGLKFRAWQIEVYSTWKLLTAVFYSVGDSEIDIKYIKEIVVKKYGLDPANTCINRWYEINRYGTPVTPTPSLDECYRQKLERDYFKLQEVSQN